MRSAPAPTLFAMLALALAAATAAPRAAAAAGNASAGEGIFEVQCADCHSVAPGRMMNGPSLYGVVGRKAGSLPHYRYSKAMRDSGIVWTPATLDAYLAAPMKDIPGIKMYYPGIVSAQSRADVIAYLASLHP